MENITFGDVGRLIAFLATIIGSCGVIYAALKKAIKKLFDDITKEIKGQIENVDIGNSKNYLVTFLARVDRMEEIDEIELIRFWEQYEHYIKIGGNSYIKNKTEKLKQVGRL